jgi:GT2 family glycosyltransferase
MKHGVYIATKNRETEVIKFLDSLILNKSEYELILIDSTEPKERFETFQENIRKRYPKLKITHIFHFGRLPSARNAGLDLNLSHDLIHFFDDDVTIPDDYFGKIEQFLSFNSDVMGGGPRIKGIYVPSSEAGGSPLREGLRLFKNFRLKVRKYGRVNSACKHHWVPDRDGINQVVDWIPGCCMFFRPEVFEELRFNQFMETGFNGYAFGEDMEFTFRASRQFKFMATDSTVIEHHLAPSPRSELDFIASCLGATTAHMYSMFPGHFSKFNIYIGKIAEFFLKCVYLEGNRVQSFFRIYAEFNKEFKRELRDRNWRLR